MVLFVTARALSVMALLVTPRALAVGSIHVLRSRSPTPRAAAPQAAHLDRAALRSLPSPGSSSSSGQASTTSGVADTQALHPQVPHEEPQLLDIGGHPGSSYGEDFAAASGDALPTLLTTSVNNARVPLTRGCAASSPRQSTFKFTQELCPTPACLSQPQKKKKKKKCPCPEFMDSQKRCPHCLQYIWYKSGETIRCPTYGHYVHVECWGMEGASESEED